jgi:hypothetical protein
MMRRLLPLVALMACAAAQTPRTLGKGVAAAGLSVGGPVTRIPGVGNIPLPYAVLEGRYGVSDQLDIHAGTHVLTDALGTPQLDLGATRMLVNERPGDKTAVALTGKAMLFFGAEEFTILPEAILTFSTRIKQRSFFYGGLDVVVGQGATVSGEASGDEGTQIIATPFLGGQVPVGKRARVSLESGWIAPYLNTRDAVVTFPIPGAAAEGGLGALSFKLGVSVPFATKGKAKAQEKAARASR